MTKPCMKPWSLLMLPIVLAISADSMAQQDVPSCTVDRLMQKVLKQDRLPSISAAVSAGGGIVYARAFGFADLEKEVPATVTTRYPIGSVSKTITAVAALQLGQQNKLDLDASIERYCSAFPPKRQPITVRQLLAHTGGIRHYDYRRFEEDYLNRRHFKSIAEALQKFAKDPLVADPGSKYHYSSWGYVALGCCIEVASGQAYADYIEANILTKTGLSHTGVDPATDDVPHRARGYYHTDSGTLAVTGPFNPSDRIPAGGLLSTPVDLVRFGEAIMAGRLLGDRSRELMWSSAKLASGEKTGHGLGWKLADDGAEAFHGGTTVGATAFLYVRPADRLAVAIAVNLSLWDRDRYELAKQLERLVQSGPERN